MSTGPEAMSLKEEWVDSLKRESQICSFLLIQII